MCNKNIEFAENLIEKTGIYTARGNIKKLANLICDKLY